MLNILPRFVALEMIADISSLDEELSPHEFLKIHQYRDVRYCFHVKIACSFVISVSLHTVIKYSFILVYFLQTSRILLFCQ